MMESWANIYRLPYNIEKHIMKDRTMTIEQMRQKGAEARKAAKALRQNCRR